MHVVILDWKTRADAQVDEVVGLARQNTLYSLKNFVELMKVLGWIVVEDSVVVDRRKWPRCTTPDGRRTTALGSQIRKSNSWR